MSRNLSHVYSLLRQRSFPAAFRIDLEPGGDWTVALVGAMSDLLGAARKASASSGLDRDFAISLCNEYFKLGRNVKRLADQGNESEDMQRIRTALDDIDQLLQRHEIECLDLSGQTYDLGRRDFESIAEARRVPGLKAARIALCERPMVLIKGKLAQTARGLVEIPA